MSATVANIVEQASAIAATTLGEDYQPLQFLYDLSKLNERTAALGFAFRPLSADTAPGPNRTYSLHHRFEFILTNVLTRGGSDVELVTLLGVMYDQSDELFKAMVNTKLNLPLTVVNVFDPSISEPEFIEKIVALRMQFTVLYRSALP